MTQNVDTERLLCMAFPGHLRGSSYRPIEARRNPNKMSFSWQTQCNHRVKLLVQSKYEYTNGTDDLMPLLC